MKPIVTFSILLILFSQAFAQKEEPKYIWQNITVFESNCEDVKKILKVKSCSVPSSSYSFEKYDLIIKFSREKNEWNVKKGKVIYFNVLLKVPIKLSDYEKDLSNYKSKLTDTFDLVFTNKQKGVEILTTNDVNEKWIMNITIFPPKAKLSQ